MFATVLVILALLLSSPELALQSGISLAREGNYNSARIVLESARQNVQTDKRFALELAGIEFKTKRYSEAKAYLKEALKLDPEDHYANQFLGAIFYVEGNLEGALKYWNRIGQPQITGIRMKPTPDVDPVLLDHSFAVAPASLLTLEEYRETARRLKLLGIFSRFKFDLSANSTDDFTLVFYPMERDFSAWSTAIRSIRGLPYETVYLDLFNLKNHAINSRSLFRWNSDRSRFFTSLSTPFRNDPSLRFTAQLDYRDENWELPSESPFSLRTTAFSLALDSLVDHRFSWSTGSEITYSSSPSETTSITYDLGAEFILIDQPERRFTMRAIPELRVGRSYSDTGNDIYAQTEIAIRSLWFPKPKNDDWTTSFVFRYAHSFGTVPFTDLWSVGIDRDHDRWIRAHKDLSGAKGKNPIGDRYFLANFDIEKSVYQHSFFQLRIAPFIDIGQVLNSPFDQEELMIDAGVQLKLRLPGAMTLQFGYGKDLRSGRNTFFWTL